MELMRNVNDVGVTEEPTEENVRRAIDELKVGEFCKLGDWPGATIEITRKAPDSYSATYMESNPEFRIVDLDHQVDIETAKGLLISFIGQERISLQGRDSEKWKLFDQTESAKKARDTVSAELHSRLAAHDTGLADRVIAATNLNDEKPSSYLVGKGEKNEKMLCPHCQTKGQVFTKQTSKKAGVSGGKATGALLTAGLSLLLTGLSRSEEVTQAYCANCESSWQF